MSETVLRVEHLSKRYKLGRRASYKALRDTLSEIVAAPYKLAQSLARRSPPLQEPSDDYIWALHDVSFEVGRGELVGLIGRNGAGKSTLLKILSRITRPTHGYVFTAGRVGSLLEVGTGFHAELTGRENIYLNGAILGMKRFDIARRFDEIIEFAGVEHFVDTPVKHYSSGMYLRLAFAVAAHLEPEILILDEILAVGDAEFQKKCYNKMQEIGSGGRTIVFVSHNMAAIRQICRRGVALDQGNVVDSGEINQVVDHYLARVGNQASENAAVENGLAVVNEVAIQSERGAVIMTFDPVTVRVVITAKVDIVVPDLYLAILAMDNQRVVGLNFKDFVSVPRLQRGQQSEFVFAIRELPLLPGEYQIELFLKDMDTYKTEVVPATFAFTIVESPVYGGRKVDGWNGFVGLRAEGSYRVS